VVATLCQALGPVLSFEGVEAGLQVVGLMPCPLDAKSPERYIEKLADYCGVSLVEATGPNIAYKLADLALYVADLEGRATTAVTLATL